MFEIKLSTFAPGCHTLQGYEKYPAAVFGRLYDVVSGVSVTFPFVPGGASAISFSVGEPSEGGRRLLAVLRRDYVSLWYGFLDDVTLKAMQVRGEHDCQCYDVVVRQQEKGGEPWS